MTIRPVRLFGDPVLRQPAVEVADFDRALRTLVKDLTETLRDQRGSGLAAPQVGVGLRVFVFHVNGVAGHIVNPQVDLPDEQEQEGPEGCLSMPGLYFDTRRRLNAVGRGVDMHGRPVQVIGTGDVARCLQHEADHLDGVLFIDRLDRDARKAALKAIREAEWANQSAPNIKFSPHRSNGFVG